MKPASPHTIQAFVEVLNYLIIGIEIGSIKAEFGKEKQLRELQRKAQNTLAMARQRREIR